ncbi:MAG: acyl-CoA thioesterase [Deltaproteobacteria bacterium]|nr:acyl-CoA thioesterase [Deltaproteobacteria bacterium]MBI4373916.1 acyl-CoA thioesterase [Deltaproteobacteria bacterium]
MRFPVKTEVTVFFSDCDPMGHCNNARFLTFMEQARVQYYKRLKALDLRRMNARTAFGFIVAEATCSFKSPAYIDETLVIGTRIASVGNKSFVFEYEIREKKTKRLVATARTVQVMFNYQKNKSFPVPAALRKKIERLERHSCYT